jgi:hypothetical protein
VSGAFGRRPGEQGAGVAGQHIRRERLGEIQRRAGGDGGGPAFLVAACRQHDDRQAPEGRMLADEREHFEAVHVRHVEIEHHQRCRTKRELLDRFKSARRLGEAAVTDLAERGHDHSAHCRRVVHYKGSVHGPVDLPFSPIWRGALPGFAPDFAAQNG